MKRAEIKQFQRTTGTHDARFTEDHGACSVRVNLRHAGEIEDDVDRPSFCECAYHSTQVRFRSAFYQVSLQIENLNPFFLALMELETHDPSVETLPF